MTFDSLNLMPQLLENVKGRIAPGLLADFTVLDKSPFDVPPEEISHLTVEQTFLGGQQVYQRT